MAGVLYGSLPFIAAALGSREKYEYKKSTVKPCYSAPAYEYVPTIEHSNFILKNNFHLFIGIKENLTSKFDQSLKIGYSGVLL